MANKLRPIDYVKNTSKCLIIEKFNDAEEVPALNTILLNESGGEELNDAINKALSFRSFREFEARFSPFIYESVFQDEDGISFVYSTERPAGDYRQMNIAEHPFYKAVMSIYEQKGVSGNNNNEFDYSVLEKLISPRSRINEINNIKKTYIYAVNKFLELQKENPKNPELVRYSNNIRDCRETVRRMVSESPMNVLPLLLEGKKEQLKLLVGSISKCEGEQKLLPGKLIINKDGNYEYKASEESEAAKKQLSANNKASDEAVEQIVKCTTEDYKAFANSAIKDNDVVKGLVISAFTGEKAQLETVEPDQLEADIKVYQKLYGSSMESFARSVITIVEKFMGVKAFFDNASGGKDRLDEGCEFIVTNCTVDELTQEPVKTQFSSYLNNVNRTASEHIWLAVIPGMDCDECRISNVEDFSSLDPFRSQVGSEENTMTKTDRPSAAEVKELLEAMKQSKIVTFINYKACKGTSFSALTKERVEKWKNNLNIENKYVSFAFPSFTILPENKSAINIGADDMPEYLVFPGVYVDAAYVAAGITAAWMKLPVLRSRGFRINEDYPSVRFDIEKGDNSKRLTTNMNRETKLERDKDTSDFIASDRFGFCFGDNRLTFDGSFLRNAYVVNARVMEKGNNGRTYLSLYKVFLGIFVTLMVNSMSAPPTTKTLEAFMEYANDWVDDAQIESRRYDNSLVMEGESIKLSNQKILIEYEQEAEPIFDDEIIEEA